jgi:adenosylcobinamide-GDP ribazoletransferase
MIKEFKRLLGCFSYFTRIPVWKLVNTSDIDMKETIKYFPLVGAFVGTFIALVIYSCSLFLPKEFSILLGMALTLMLTGAIHEDGFADVCDGFGAGYTKDRILDIMKDSSTGVFGGAGLMMILALRFFAIFYLPIELLVPSLIAGNSISRWCSISFLFTHNYARKEETSKSTVFVKKTPWGEFLLMTFFALLSFLLFPIHILPFALLLIIPIFLFKTLLGVYFKSKIDGYTGDCMGATQQMAEILFYLGIFIITKHIL